MIFFPKSLVVVWTSSHQETPVGVEDEDLSPRQMMSDRQEATQFLGHFSYGVC